MRRLALVGLAMGLIWGCVGDDSGTPQDGGNDATLDSPIDAGSDVTNDVAVADAAPDVDAGPPIDGGFAFAGHWQTFSNSANAGVASIALNPTGGYVIGGSYSGGSAEIGTYGLPTSSGTRDAYVGTLDSAGKVTGAVGFGGSGADDVLAVAADANGDIYIAGLSLGGLVLNGQSLAAGTFLAKLKGSNLTAAPIWTRTFSTSVPCPTCLVQSGSDLVLATTMLGTFNYGNGSFTSDGGFDIALLKFDSTSGSFVWAGQIGGSGSDSAQALAMDSSRNVYFLGNMGGPTLQAGQALGSKTPTGPGTNANLLVAKFDSSSTPAAQWAFAYGDPGGTTVNGQGIAVDTAGHVAVAATFNGGINFGMGATGSAGTDGIVFIFDDSNQKTIWQQVIGDNGTDRTSGVAFDAWGHLLVGGTYQGSPQIGSGHLDDAGMGPYGTYLAKFGPPPTWAGEWGVGFRQLDAGSSASIGSSAIAVAPSGVSAIAGGYNGTTDFGSGPMTALSSSTTSDAYVAGRLP